MKGDEVQDSGGLVLIPFPRFQKYISRNAYTSSKKMGYQYLPVGDKSNDMKISTTCVFLQRPIDWGLF